MSDTTTAPAVTGTGSLWRKKRITVEAIQWTGDNYGAVRRFSGGAIGIGPVDGDALPLWVAKSSATCHVQLGDWVIREPDGTGYYPCEASAFEAGFEPAADESSSDGQFMTIAFMGHNELTGYVTEITLGGESGYRVELPDRLWGGNPHAWAEYSAKVLFSRRPVSEESVRAAWESQRRRAAERARQQAEWARAQEQPAITSGPEADDGVLADEYADYGEHPQF